MRASKRSVMGFLVTLTMTAGLLIGVVSPAAAAPAGAAEVDVKNILAGTPATTYTISVKNNEAVGNSTPVVGSTAGQTMNFVSIAVPTAGWTISSASGPAGEAWSPVIWGDLRGVDFYSTGATGTIAPQATKAFSVIANAPTPNKDLSKLWTVWGSSDGGASIGSPLGSKGAGLDTTVRILTAEFPGFTQPAGITDLSVTQGQGSDPADQTATRQPKGLCAISNHGSGTVSVKATMTGDQVDSGGESAAQSLTPGQSDAPYSFNLKFGNPGTKATTCNAKAYAADGVTVIAQTVGGFNETKNVVIEPRVTFTVNDFSPKVVVPGQVVSFSVDVTAQGVPAANLASPATNLEFDTPAGKFGPVALTSSGSFPRGAAGARRVVLTFAAAAIPGSAVDDPLTPADDRTRGRFDILADLIGEDDNNTTISFVDQNIGKITLDPDIPVLNLNAPDGPGFPAQWTAVQSQPDYDKVPEAVKNGSTVSLTGTVKDVDPQTGLLVNCGSCTILESYLRQFGADGNEITGARINCPATNSGGNISCGYAGAYNPGAVKFDWVVVASDSLHSAGTDSVELEIDNIFPQILSATTSRKADSATDPTGQDRNTVLVTFDECVAGTSSAAAWKVEVGGSTTSHQPVAVGAPTCKKLADGSFRSFVEITTAANFPDDANDPGKIFGAVTYRPVLGGDRYMDRVDNTFCAVATNPNGCAKNLLDGIAPLASTISSVTPGSSDEGKLWTNTTSPTIVITGKQDEGQRALKDGYEIELYEESNATNGLQRGTGGDRLLATRIVASTDCTGTLQSGTCTVSVPANGLSFDEGDKTLYAIAGDTAPTRNLSPSTLATLVLDQTVPVIVQVTPTVGRIVLTFSEPIAFGRNFASDYRIFNADEDTFRPDTVTVGGLNREVRNLNMSDPRYNAANISRVFYEFHGPQGTRYADRATNELGDFRVDITTG